MNSEQLIKDLLNKGEGEQLEFKEVVRKDAIGKTICSFLNNDGGQILIGIGPRKKIIGISNAEKWKKELEQYLVKELVPEAPVMVSVEIVGNKKLILVKVWAGSKKPYVLEGGIFYRRNGQTVQASSKEISSLIHDRQLTEIHWERQPALGVELEDLDLEEIQKTIDTAWDENKMKERKYDPIDFLSYYGLFQNGHFTNAAVILFGKKPARFIPQVRTRIAFLSGGKTADKYYDDQLLEENLFKSINTIQIFLEKHLSYSRNFERNNWQHKAEYIFPMAALREGIMNALVHRDYSNVSGSASLIIYPDKLEIINIGKLPLKVTELKKNHLSMPVNPDIAHMVFLRGYMEKIGRGTLKIIDACKEAKLKAPVWVSEGNTVKLSFFSKVKLQGAIEGANKGAVKGASKRTNEGAIEGAIEGATKGVKEKLSILLSTIAANEGQRVPEYKELTNLTDSSMERYIRILKNAGLIEFKGDAAHTGGYFLTKRMRTKIK